MKAKPLPPNEDERLRLLRNLESMDTGAQEMFTLITQAVALICDAPLALISLGDEYRPWFEPETSPDPQRDEPFYPTAIQHDGVLLIPDVQADERYANDTKLNAEPPVRFYAGTPLKLTPTIRLGILSVIDYRPRMLDDKQLQLLELMAVHLVTLIRLKLDRVESNLDFSALVTVKQKLQFQKELMEAVFDNEPESVTILSPDGRLEQINRAGLEMLEIDSLTETSSRRLVDYVQPEFRPRFDEMCHRVFHGKHAISEYRITGARGTERWMESHAAPLYDQQSRIVNLIAVTRDTTRIKQSQARLQLAARVFSDAQEGIIITDAGGTIVDVNPAFCRITGYHHDEIVGQKPSILHSGRQGPGFYAALWKTLIATGHWKGEIWNRKKNGELYAELISISALRDASGNTINYVGLFLDITPLKHHTEAPITKSPHNGG